jgi:serine phosphatase RsbU (regulator of sigma subunit)/anti-sigma regulatory factor (Ser/Thr protein kinase)
MADAPALSQPAALRVVQRCDLDEVRATADAVRKFLTAQGCGATDIADLELVLVEGCNNAVKYTSAPAQHLLIVIECLCDGHKVELRIHDHTDGFNWPAKAILPPADSEGGRGIFLMSSLMETVNYFRAVGENMLLLRRQLTSQPQTHSVVDPQEQERVIAEMVEELSSCYESLSAIFRYSAVRTSASELRDFAQRLLNDLRQITGATWFVLRLKSRTESRLETFVASEVVLQLPPLAIAENAATTVELLAAKQRRTVWFGGDQPLPTDDPLVIQADSHGLVHPIFAGENLVGTLAMGKTKLPDQSHFRTAGFTAGHTNVIGTFSEFLASQVLNAHVQEERVARRLVEHELAIASSIQQSLLPRELPQLPGLQLAAYCRSAQQVGGDFYDVLRVSDREVFVVIADVMGKGIPAAMFAAILRSLVRALPELAREPAALMTRINQLLFSELSNVDMFITAQFVFLDHATGRLAVASAGHCPLLLASAGAEVVREIAPTGMPLGVQQDATFVGEVLQLPPQAHLLLYTDGLSEALNPQGERFGPDRLAQRMEIITQRKLSAEAAKASLATALQDFQANLALNDDETFLIMARQNS